MSAWLLPESIADVLPSEARRLEELRRRLLDRFRCYGYEMVAPPLLEYAESLLSSTGQDLDLKTFKLIDQASGKTICVRADTTPQVARIDAHLLNRRGITRLCYCGPVLHTLIDGLHATRDPLQLGAELFGHSGVEADLEVLRLAMDTLSLACLTEVRIDLCHAGLLPALLDGLPRAEELANQLHLPLAQKDPVRVEQILTGVASQHVSWVIALMSLYGLPLGPSGVLERARKTLLNSPSVLAVLDNLEIMATAIDNSGLGISATVDLADLRSYNYHSGAMFAAYVCGSPRAVLRGGRYDNVGEVFGRPRPATGFSLDLKHLVSLSSVLPPRANAIRAPWSEDKQLGFTIRQLRDAGEIVVQSLPGHEHEEEEFEFDRELILQNTQWCLQPVSKLEKSE